MTLSWIQHVSRLSDVNSGNEKDNTWTPLNWNSLYWQSAASVKLPGRFRAFLPVPLVCFILRSDNTPIFSGVHWSKNLLAEVFSHVRTSLCNHTVWTLPDTNQKCCAYFFINITTMERRMVSRTYRTEQSGLALYSGDVRFVCVPGHRLSWLRLFVLFLCSS
jgi:hypothetical protein